MRGGKASNEFVKPRFSKRKDNSYDYMLGFIT